VNKPLTIIIFGSVALVGIGRDGCGAAAGRLAAKTHKVVKINGRAGGGAAVPVVYLGGAGGLRLGALAFARRGGVTLHRVVVEIVQQVVGPLQHGGVQLFRFGRPAVQILVIAHQQHMQGLVNKKQTEG
jgi:hypothetical protein